jgi:hypothetical protein
MEDESFEGIVTAACIINWLLNQMAKIKDFQGFFVAVVCIIDGLMMKSGR